MLIKQDIEHAHITTLTPIIVYINISNNNLTILISSK